MRRAGNLYGRILDWDNLRLAFYRASRGKRNKPEILSYRQDLDGNLSVLAERLSHPERMEIGGYRHFTVHDPKERMICVAPFAERVLHHAVMNVLEPVFESFQIHDSYACRKGKGTDAALRRALFFTRRAPFFLKLDVRKYFDSIPHGTLKGLLARRFKDKKALTLLEAVIDSYETSPERGIPIGNLSSQHFANFHLGHLDHFIKEDLRVRHYLRYMDDMALFGDSTAELDLLFGEIRRFCEEALGLELKPPVVGCVETGLPFPGFLVKPSGVFLSRRKKRRSTARIMEYERNLRENLWTEQEYADHILPVCAHRQPQRQPWLPPCASQLTNLGFSEPTVSGAGVAPPVPVGFRGCGVRALRGGFCISQWRR